MELDALLRSLDLNDNQIRVYIALLQLGTADIQTVARKSAVKRTTAYSILDTLIQRGFVAFNQKGAHRQYFAEDPHKLPSLLQEQIRQIETRQQRIKTALPELASIYNAHGTKPKIRFYDGIEGIKQVFEETLQVPAGTETFAYSSAESIHEYLKDYVPNYLARRIRAGITQRALAEDSPIAREHLKNDVLELRQTILLPKELFPFSNEINIFGNKMFIASYRDLLAVIIESEEITRTQRTIFELAWLGAQQVSITKM
ncbi:MAG: helix-turn-helix domain-containing protein [Patescibacteria group bacterium]